MAEVQAKALYAFDGDTESGELSFKSGDTLTVLQQDVGDGWWEARNYLGNVGLIPQAYVQAYDQSDMGVVDTQSYDQYTTTTQEEQQSFPQPYDFQSPDINTQVIEPPEPSFPPPPPPVSVPTAPPAPAPAVNNGWGKAPAPHAKTTVQQQQSLDTWDDDWDDDDDDGESSTSTAGASTPTDLPGQGNFGLSQAKPKGERPASSPTGDMSRYGTVKKSFNRFSTFAKAGGEAFMMGQFTGNVSEADLIQIIETDDGVAWHTTDVPFTCGVKSPKKESKYKGMKSYIAYSVTPSFSNIQVSRRYKHFDWLYIQLENKYTCVPIPPLPDKAISGRYEDEFIDSRMKFLQKWIDRICRHPVLSKSDVFHHFLTCTDEKKWKQGKRRAEKDEYTGGNFFLTLQTPPNGIHMGEVDGKMENVCKFVKHMDENVRGLLTVAYDNRKKHLGPYKREYQKIGHAFKSLAATFNLDSSISSRPLTGAIDYTGDTYNQIGDMFEKQPRNDLEPLMDTLNEYKGILVQFPNVLKVHEGAVGKAKECLKQQQEGRMVDSVVQTVTQRADVISYGTMAEISHFQQARNEDFKAVMKTYLQGQIEFYRGITSRLEDALKQVDNS